MSTDDLPPELPAQPPRLYAARAWPGPLRLVAIVLWTSFLGAGLLLVALLMSWEALQAATDPQLGTLSLCFVMAWLISALIAAAALSLATPPRSALGSPDE